ncbi:MAG: NADPH-dependent oxidoreductase [Opitutus sp.]|nr:NADPH-dependent oxidoreductase [Opitutus sp.]
MPNLPRILAFSGSSRRESLNKKLLAAVVAAARAAGGDVTVIELGELSLPLYDGDLEDEKGLPENVAMLVTLIVSHDALLIASPEYNSQITPLLKNAIDWCTRADENPFKGKVAAVVSASPGMFGGIRSMTLARQLLTALGSHVIPAQCVLPQAHQAFDDQGALKDERSRKAAQAVAVELLRVAAKLSG